MKRYLIHLDNNGFEFQTQYYINTKEFWEELAHDSYFQIGEGIYIPLEERNIVSINFIGEN